MPKTVQLSVVPVSGSTIQGIKNFNPDDFDHPEYWNNRRVIFSNDSIYYPGVAKSIHASIVAGDADEAYVIFVAHPAADGAYESYINYVDGKHNKDLYEYPDYTALVMNGVA